MKGAADAPAGSAQTGGAGRGTRGPSVVMSNPQGSNPQRKHLWNG